MRRVRFQLIMALIDDGQNVPTTFRITDQLLPDLAVNPLSVGITADCKVGGPLVDDSGILVDVGRRRQLFHRLKIPLYTALADEL